MTFILLNPCSQQTTGNTDTRDTNLANAVHLSLLVNNDIQNLTYFHPLPTNLELIMIIVYLALIKGGGGGGGCASKC
jgi:hypothetical protein